MAGCFISTDEGGALHHWFRIGDHLATDDQELLAQGRLAENRARIRDYNRLPSFKDRAAARVAFETGKLPGVRGDWQSWRHNILPEMDDFRDDYRRTFSFIPAAGQSSGPPPNSP